MNVRPLRAASRTVVRELGFLESTWATEDISHVQCHALLELDHVGTALAGELAETLRVDKSGISRAVRALRESGLIEAREDRADARSKPLALTETGRERVREIHASADAEVVEALATLAPEEAEAVSRGMLLYAKALARKRAQRDIVLRRATPRDDPGIKALIRTVMPEFGCVGPGYAIDDPEVEAMSRSYRGKRARYFVLDRAGRIVGGAGFAALEGGEADTCELRKMYFLPEARGLGLGPRLLAAVLDAATAAGFRRCYLETTERMHDARRLYEAFGFERLDARMGDTGHHSCESWYARALG